MALYMVQNDLDEDTVINDGYKLDFQNLLCHSLKVILDNLSMDSTRNCKMLFLKRTATNY